MQLIHPRWERLGNWPAVLLLSYRGARKRKVDGLSGGRVVLNCPGDFLRHCGYQWMLDPSAKLLPTEGPHGGSPAPMESPLPSATFPGLLSKFVLEPGVDPKRPGLLPAHSNHQTVVLLPPLQ